LIHIKAVVEGRAVPEVSDEEISLHPVSWERCEAMKGVEINYRPGLLTPEDLTQIAELIKSLVGGESHE